MKCAAISSTSRRDGHSSTPPSRSGGQRPNWPFSGIVLTQRQPRGRHQHHSRRDPGEATTTSDARGKKATHPRSQFCALKRDAPAGRGERAPPDALPRPRVVKNCARSAVPPRRPRERRTMTHVETLLPRAEAMHLPISPDENEIWERMLRHGMCLSLLRSGLPQGAAWPTGPTARHGRARAGIQHTTRAAHNGLRQHGGPMPVDPRRSVG